MSTKVAHVRAATQTRPHGCHWPGCTRQVPPAMWGCREHWFKLPKRLRDRIWAAYVPGQEERLDPSRKYLEVADEVQDWIRQHGSTGAKPTQLTRVGHWKLDHCDVYIGRGSVWGNPYASAEVASRSRHGCTASSDPLGDYEKWLRAQPHLMAQLPDLAGKVLGCWCVRLADSPPPPERCHGHVIVRLLKEELGHG